MPKTPFFQAAVQLEKVLSSSMLFPLRFAIGVDEGVRPPDLQKNRLLVQMMERVFALVGPFGRPSEPDTASDAVLAVPFMLEGVLTESRLHSLRFSLGALDAARATPLLDHRGKLFALVGPFKDAEAVQRAARQLIENFEEEGDPDA